MKEDFPNNEIEYDRCFCNEQACIEYFFQLRWSVVFVCSQCSYTGYCKSARGLYICSHCEHQQSATAGTIFHGTKKPLIVWFKALWWFSTRRSSVNAVTLKDMLSLGSYKTAKFSDLTAEPASQLVSVSGGCNRQ